MQIVFRSRLWATTLRVTNALSAAGIQTATDTKGANGSYSVAVDMREVRAANRVIFEVLADAKQEELFANA